MPERVGTRLKKAMLSVDTRVYPLAHSPSAYAGNANKIKNTQPKPARAFTLSLSLSLSRFLRVCEHWCNSGVCLTLLMRELYVFIPKRSSEKCVSDSVSVGHKSRPRYIFFIFTTIRSQCIRFFMFFPLYYFV